MYSEKNERKDKIEKVHYLRNDTQALCGRDATKVKSSTLSKNVDCIMCAKSIPVELNGSLEDIIKILQDNRYGLNGTKPVFIKLINGRLFVRRSRWMKWDKIDENK